uniref:Si:ch211-274p24.2 n=1 Tax=Esox lucius TaxID=8010 RepID=A0A3P8ZKD9_ESOLU
MSTHFLSVKKGPGVVVNNMRPDDKLRLLHAETETTEKHKKKDVSIKKKMKQTNMKSKDMTKLSSLGSEKSTTSSFKGAPAPSSEGVSSEHSVQDMESLRWEGMLEDPLAEERRLEVYRANRRQRYLLQRQEVKAVGSSGHPESRDLVGTRETE